LPPWGAAILLLVIGGCATAPGALDTRGPAALSPDSVRFELTGRIAVQNGDEGMSGLLRWLHAPEADELWFSSPVGGSVARLVRDRDGVELVRGNGPSRRAPSAEVLTREALGWDLPLAGLEYWILGRPAPGNGTERIERDPASGRLTRLVQDGWIIEYRRFLDTERGALPALVNLEYGSLQIRLAVDRWDLEP
jgi:outer membrane lipoprotein LolB